MKKVVYRCISGAKKTDMLRVDNDIHAKIKKKKLKFGLIKGLYVYHWYRNGDKNYIKHLK